MWEPNVQLSQSRQYTASFWYKNTEDDGHQVPCHLDALSRRHSSINQTVVRMHLKVLCYMWGKSSFRECLTLIFSTLAEVYVWKKPLSQQPTYKSWPLHIAWLGCHQGEMQWLALSLTHSRLIYIKGVKFESTWFNFLLRFFQITTLIKLHWLWHLLGRAILIWLDILMWLKKTILQLIYKCF